MKERLTTMKPIICVKHKLIIKDKIPAFWLLNRNTGLLKQLSRVHRLRVAVCGN